MKKRITDWVTALGGWQRVLTCGIGIIDAALVIALGYVVAGMLFPNSTPAAPSVGPSPMTISEMGAAKPTAEPTTTAKAIDSPRKRLTGKPAASSSPTPSDSAAAPATPTTSAPPKHEPKPAITDSPATPQPTAPPAGEEPAGDGDGEPSKEDPILPIIPDLPLDLPLLSSE